MNAILQLAHLLQVLTCLLLAWGSHSLCNLLLLLLLCRCRGSGTTRIELCCQLDHPACCLISNGWIWMADSPEDYLHCSVKVRIGCTGPGKVVACESSCMSIDLTT
jgi:hypothetical protein